MDPIHRDGAARQPSHAREWLEANAVRDDDDTTVYGSDAGEDSALMFGRSKVEAIPRFLRTAYFFAGMPMKEPNTLLGRLYTWGFDVGRVGCLLLCFSRLIYARGPSYTERHSTLTFVLFHLFCLTIPIVTRRYLRTPNFRAMLREVDGPSGDETAKQLRKTLVVKSVGALTVPVFISFFGIAAFVPLFLDPFHTGHDALPGDRFYGIFSGVYFAV